MPVLQTSEQPGHLLDGSRFDKELPGSWTGLLLANTGLIARTLAGHLVVVRQGIIRHICPLNTMTRLVEHKSCVLSDRAAILCGCEAWDFPGGLQILLTDRRFTLRHTLDVKITGFLTRLFRLLRQQ